MLRQSVLFLVEHYTIQMDIVCYYLSLYAPALKLLPKINTHLFIDLCDLIFGY